MAHEKHSVSKRPLPKRRILVLDGETRPALAAVRALGECHCEIAVISRHRYAIAAGSKFCSVLFVLPDPRKEGAKYAAELLAIIRQWRPEQVIPITDVSLAICLQYRGDISLHTCLPCTDEESLNKVTNKLELMNIAEALGIRTPKTFLVPNIATRTSADVAMIKSFPFPAVLKTQSTESSIDEGYQRRPVYYPSSADEALSLVSVSTLGPNSRVPFLLQERIKGPGVGVFALCWEGEAASIFCHRRLLEYPPSGGPSVLSESIPESEAPVADACRLLEALNWRGVAMVEFKQHSDGEFYLMEINPRFWGSLQLSVTAGRNYPELMLRLFSSSSPAQSLAEVREKESPYRTDVRLRWLLGTLAHAWSKLRAAPLSALKEILLENSLELLRQEKQTVHDVYRTNDIWPFLYELRSFLVNGKLSI